MATHFNYKLLILYSMSFILLLVSNFPGGALIALYTWMQVSIVLCKKDYSLSSQIKFSIFFLSLAPTFILWGSVNAFLSIYANQGNIFFVCMYSILGYILCFWLTLFSVFSFIIYEKENTILELYLKCLGKIKYNKFLFFITSLVVFLISILKIPLDIDFRIVLGITIAQLFIRWRVFDELHSF